MSLNYLERIPHHLPTHRSLEHMMHNPPTAKVPAIIAIISFELAFEAENYCTVLALESLQSKAFGQPQLSYFGVAESVMNECRYATLKLVLSLVSVEKHCAVSNALISQAFLPHLYKISLKPTK